jgi:hypothetical protein
MRRIVMLSGLLACPVALFASANGASATQVDLSAPGANAGEARLAVNPEGDAVAVWERVDPDGNRIVQAAVREGYAFTARVDLCQRPAATRMCRRCARSRG